MDSRKVLEYLENFTFRLGVEIIYEKLEGEEFSARGGLCKFKGTYKIFMDRSETIEGQIRILARALSSFDTEGLYILPFIREILDKTQSTSEYMRTLIGTESYQILIQILKLQIFLSIIDRNLIF